MKENLCEPQLGCATTEQLLLELEARADGSWPPMIFGQLKGVRSMLSAPDLAYRTVDQ